MVAPVYPLEPVRIVNPVPFWVSAPVPPITPDNVVVPDCNVVSNPLSVTRFANVPLVAKLSARVAPLLIETRLLELMDPAVPFPICNVPVVTAVAPV